MSKSDVTQVRRVKPIVVTKVQKPQSFVAKENKNKPQSNARDYPVLKRKHVKDSKFNFDMAHIL